MEVMTTEADMQTSVPSLETCRLRLSELVEDMLNIESRMERIVVQFYGPGPKPGVDQDKKARETFGTTEQMAELLSAADRAIISTKEGLSKVESIVLPNNP